MAQYFPRISVFLFKHFVATRTIWLTRHSKVQYNVLQVVKVWLQTTSYITRENNTTKIQQMYISKGNYKSKSETTTRTNNGKTKKHNQLIKIYTR